MAFPAGRALEILLKMKKQGLEVICYITQLLGIGIQYIVCSSGFPGICCVLASGREGTGRPLDDVCKQQGSGRSLGADWDAHFLDM